MRNLLEGSKVDLSWQNQQTWKCTEIMQSEGHSGKKNKETMNRALE